MSDRRNPTEVHPTGPAATAPTPRVDPDLDPTHVDRRVQELFGDVEDRRPRRRLRLAAAATAVVLAVGLVAASVAGSQDGAELRTATARTADVSSELTSVATMEAVSAAAVAFPSDGTVATVDVAVGDTVGVGAQLASLDEVELTRSRNAAVQELAAAELALSQALAGEEVDGAAGGATMTPTSGATTGTAASGATATVALLTTAGSDDQVVQLVAASDELAALQQAVLAAQRDVDAALLAAQSALDAADVVCDADEVAEATTTTVTTSTTATAADDLTACRAALVAVQQAQEATAEAQQTLAAASTALDDHLAQQAASQGSDSPEVTDGAGTAGAGSTGGLGAGGSSASGPASGTSGATSSSPSAADLIAYQKAVSAAELQVLVADQALAQASIVSPIAGTVVAVGVEVGDSVSAASATQNVTIQGVEGVEVVTTVALEDIASVELGQPATVVPDGSAEALDGEVVAISPVPDSDSTTYRVTIGLTDPAAELDSGTTGSVAIVTADARDALAVPASAVHVDARGATVTVVRDGSTDEVRVGVGVTGADWIEITSGLSEGDEVVLADLAEPLPGSATDSTTAAGDAGDVAELFGGGGFPGGPPGG